MSDRLNPEPIEGAEGVQGNERPVEADAAAETAADAMALPEDVWADEAESGARLPEADDAPEPPVELFVPTQYFQSKGSDAGAGKRRKRRRGTGRQRRAILAIALGVLLILVAIGSSYALRLYRDPGSFFDSVAASPTATPGSALLSQATPEPTPEPSATPTLDPYTALEQQADLSLMQNIVNVLVIGVDYAEERETWSGKHEYHSDVMMVLAINFDENRVDLISLPRDTYAKIPGVDGIYKLNAAINCGGGFEDPNGGGFLKTCEAASWMLGGIPVDYYY
ncbi:MAG: LCP family protein, partial [Clostridia bacterium]|nr:LCP family protein [Clostridia bacterium]